MILLLAIVAGLLAGWGRAHSRQVKYEAPVLVHVWLVFAAFLPQYLSIYLLPEQITAQISFAAVLVISQTIFVIFAFLNRNLLGMKVLMMGAILNLLVIITNHGFMPISPQTAETLIPAGLSLEIHVGDRFGEKDMILLPEQTRFEWLADRFLTPAWFPLQAAFSLGDVLIAAGVFLLLAVPKNKKVITHDRSNYVSTVVRQS